MIINTILEGDALLRLRELSDDSVDSIVTDPPYELGFMGKSWDNTGIAYNTELWRECLRVLKPGGHLLAFGGTRTYHRMAVAIEDAGFEIRDMIEWVYGSGFPKSLNIGKAVDKLQGNERYIVGVSFNEKDFRDVGKKVKEIIGLDKLSFGTIENAERKNLNITKGSSDWEGWGTALKPAHEPIVMARKPLSEKTIAENVLKYGTGGINIDESRVKIGNEKIPRLNIPYERKGDNNFGGGIDKRQGSITGEDSNGRFPANLIHDGSDEVRVCFPDTGKGSDKPRNINTLGSFGMPNDASPEYSDSSSASRFFKSIIYQAKASKSERNYGCEELDAQRHADRIIDNGVGRDNPRKRTNIPKKNFHPTVKPVALMEYLIKMITPNGGIVLDPFTGSGSTLVAAAKNNYCFVGIELEPDYITIAECRIKPFLAQKKLTSMIMECE